MPHVPFIMPSACHSTPHCQQMNAGLYILSLLSLTDAGQNEVRILHLSRDAIIVSIHNVDESRRHLYSVKQARQKEKKNCMIKLIYGI